MSHSPAPLADHHQHLFSPALVAELGAGQTAWPPITARDVAALLDVAGIRYAAVLSGAYMYGRPARTIDDEYAKVRAENDWASAQAAEFPERFRAFCSFNPLKEYALDEIARCAGQAPPGPGIKLHFGNSDVQLDNAAHVEQLARVFQAANTHRMPILVHLRASISKGRPYGTPQAAVFLEQLLPLIPDIPVQIAHLAGAGPGYDDPPAHSAMAVLAEAVEQGNPQTHLLWFDVATVVDRAISLEHAELVARLIRQVGVERVLYGSDAPLGDNLRPREGWEVFCRLPLQDDEIAQLAGNLAPYLR